MSQEDRFPGISPGAVLVVAVTLLVLNPFCCSAQDESSPTLEELTARAEGVTRDYPWLELPYNGLSLNAFELRRADFLRGLHAATDLVFEGTGELPETITAYGLFPNVTEVLEMVLRDDPFLAHEIDWERRTVTFSHKLDDSLGLSDAELSSRYRRTKPDPQLIQGNMGMVYPGALIVDGTVFPSPLLVEIVPDQTTRHYFVQANRYILKKYPYTDPFKVDADLYQAANAAELKVALLAKADSVWSQIAMIPQASTREILDMVARQISFLPGVVRPDIVNSSIVLTLEDSSQVTWSLPDGSSKRVHSEHEAFQEAFALQNRILMTLSTGGVVFASTARGVTFVENGFDLLPALERIASDEALSLREKEIEIRKSWKEHAESILEYFYTSLVSAPQSAGGETAPGQVLPQQPRFPAGPQQAFPPGTQNLPPNFQGVENLQQPFPPNQPAVPPATGAWGTPSAIPGGMRPETFPFPRSQAPPVFPDNLEVAPLIDSATPELGNSSP